MGASSSKEFDRSLPKRKSRRKYYSVLKHNFDLIEHKLKPERLADDEYEIVRQLIDTNKNDLLAVADDVKDKPKYREVYEEFLKLCNKFEEQLKSKRIPVSAPSSPSTKKRRKKKSERGVRKSLLTPEEETFHAIHRIREEMVPLRDEVLTFKGAKNDRIYHFLQESFHRHIKKLYQIETYDRVQLKYEMKIAIAYAQESQDVLDQICEGKRNPLMHQMSVDDSQMLSLQAHHDCDDDDDEDDVQVIGNGTHFIKNTNIKRNRSKSMGDYLHKTGDDDFCAGKNSYSQYPEYPDYDSSDSDYAQTSDFSDAPMTPHSIKSNFTYNFKVTSI